MVEELEKTVLLVDDEPGIRRVLSITLADIGCRVFEAANGDAALEIFKEHKPSVVITDIKMPGMDGIELLSRIKKESPETEVIMITGHGDMDLAVKSLKYDATDFITKPVNTNDLEQALVRAWQRISLNLQINSYMDDLEWLISDRVRKNCESQQLMVVGRTIAGMSHAIKNIAGGLKGGSFVLEQGIKQENREYLVRGWDMIRGNVDKIMNLALSILNYAKPSDVDFEETDPSVPAMEVVNLMLPKAKEKGVDLIFIKGEPLPPVKMRRNGVYDALLNLVTNALDASLAEGASPGKKQIRIELTQEKDWGAVYRVIDNGCGMNDSVKERVFKSFFTTKGTDGTGFGLMTTLKASEEHGGAVDFISQEGGGTTFQLKLPLQKST